jgi:hypothetical protein
MNGGPAQEPWAALLSPILWTGGSRPPWWSCWDVTLLRTLTSMILESRVLLLAGEYEVGLRGTPPSMPVSSSLPS